MSALRSPFASIWNFPAAYKSPKVWMFHLIVTMESKKKAKLVWNTNVKAISGYEKHNFMVKQIITLLTAVEIQMYILTAKPEI
jgi:hypothetical protein